MTIINFPSSPSNWLTNANLGPLPERHDQTATSGDGVVLVAEGTFASAGAIGATTYTPRVNLVERNKNAY